MRPVAGQPAPPPRRGRTRHDHRHAPRPRRRHRRPAAHQDRPARDLGGRRGPPRVCAHRRRPGDGRRPADRRLRAAVGPRAARTRRSPRSLETKPDLDDVLEREVHSIRLRRAALAAHGALPWRRGAGGAGRGAGPRPASPCCSPPAGPTCSRTRCARSPASAAPSSSWCSPPTASTADPSRRARVHRRHRRPGDVGRGAGRGLVRRLLNAAAGARHRRRAAQDGRRRLVRPGLRLRPAAGPRLHAARTSSAARRSSCSSSRCGSRCGAGTPRSSTVRLWPAAR